MAATRLSRVLLCSWSFSAQGTDADDSRAKIIAKAFTDEVASSSANIGWI